MNNENNLLEFFMGKENADHLYILIVLVILLYNRYLCSDTSKAPIEQNRI